MYRINLRPPPPPSLAHARTGNAPSEYDEVAPIGTKRAVHLRPNTRSSKHRGRRLAGAAFTAAVSALCSSALGEEFPLTKILPDDGAASSQFGYSVATDGALAIIGSHLDDGVGAAYLFDPNTSEQVAKLLAGDSQPGQDFGVSVDIDGPIAIVGARDAAYLFDTATGTQIAKLLPDDGAEGRRFGISVGISGPVAIVGACLDDDNGLSSGSAYLFDTTTGAQIAKLLASDGAYSDFFGISVDVADAIAIVGAYYDDDNGPSSGSAYLFDATTGTQLTKLLPDDGARDELFGGSVAIVGSTAIVGARCDDENGNCSGSAYLFDVTTHEQIAKLLPDDCDPYKYFGTSVAIGDEVAIVGADNDNDNGQASGAAYLFDVNTGQQITKLLPDDGANNDHFGFSTGLGGCFAIAGAHLDDDNGSASGSAYVVTLEPSLDGDLDGDGCVGQQDLGILLASYEIDDTGDIDGDGDTDQSDLGILLGNYGQGC